MYASQIGNIVSTTEDAISEEVATDLWEVIDHLKKKAQKGLSSRQLHNGSRLQSRRFDALSSYQKRLVRERINGQRITNRLSEHEYIIKWDEDLETFFVLST